MKPKYIRFDDDVIKLVEDYRKTQTPIPSFNQAVNDMIRRMGALFAVTELADRLQQSKDNQVLKAGSE